MKQLAAVYASVEDVDLFIGGLMETRTRGGGRLGHTFSCIIADQVALVRFTYFVCLFLLTARKAANTAFKNISKCLIVTSNLNTRYLI